MSPLFTSPLIAPLLAVLLALGNVPAWLHCGQCHEVAEVSAPNKCSASTRCGCSSRIMARSASPQATPSPNAIEESNSSHDSSDCVACRAATSAPPVVTSIFESPVVTIVCHESAIPSDLVYLPQVAEADRSRGPPVASTI